MRKNWIAFYISSHGYGHVTRCLAIIEGLLVRDDYNLYIVCDTFQNDFIRMYLDKYADRIVYKDMKTDVGLVTIKDSLQVDVIKLENELYEFINSWDQVVENEVNTLNDMTVSYVISDVSPIGALVGDRLGVKNIGISNFTWVEQYEALELDADIIANYKMAYAKFNYFIVYELPLELHNLKVPYDQIGFISREIDQDRVDQIRNEYGNSIFVTCGKSASLKQINISNYTGTIFTTSGIDINANGQVIKLPKNTLDTHNYIAASDLVIGKAGWGTIAESMIASRRLVLIEREGVVEDSYNINTLKERGLALSIRESDLNGIDIKAIFKKVNRCIDIEGLNRYENEIGKLIELLG